MGYMNFDLLLVQNYDLFRRFDAHFVCLLLLWHYQCEPRIRLHIFVLVYISTSVSGELMIRPYMPISIWFLQKFIRRKSMEYNTFAIWFFMWAEQIACFLNATMCYFENFFISTAYETRYSLGVCELLLWWNWTRTICKLSYEHQDLPDMFLQKSQYYTCQTPL